MLAAGQYRGCASRNACRRGGEDHDRNSSQGNDPILWAQRDSSVTDEVGQRGLVVDVQLRICLTQIMTNGRGCQAGQARDVLVRFPFGVQSHRLEFSRREPIEWRCFAQLDESQQPGLRRSPLRSPLEGPAAKVPPAMKASGDLRQPQIHPHAEPTFPGGRRTPYRFALLRGRRQGADAHGDLAATRREGAGSAID